jgi:hypothetical protein
VTRKSPDQIRAARQATIDRAIDYITSTDRDTVLAVLAKTDPEKLLQRLRDADPEPTSFFSRWKAAQIALRAAGLPYMPDDA